MQQRNPNDNNKYFFITEDDAKTLLDILNTPITSVRPEDILIGQSPTFREHPGNQQLRRFVEYHAREYLDRRTTKARKVEISKNIVNKIVNENGGRFLRRRTNTGRGPSIRDAEWEEELDQTKQQAMVASRFRGLRSRQWHPRT